jgi:hypothetical protein
MKDKTSNSSPKKGSSQSKYSYFKRLTRLKLSTLLHFSIAVLFIVGLGRYYFRQKGVKKPFQKISIFEKRQLSRPEIAQKVLLWIDNQKSQKGFYLFSKICDPNNQKCEEGDDGRTGKFVIWARFKHYQATQDKESLEKLGEDLSFYASENRMPMWQVDFWHCKLMYEVWQSELVSEELKQNAQTICQRSVYYPLNINEVEVKDFDLEKALSPYVPYAGIGDREDELSRFSAFASDYATLYQWHGGENYLKTAQYYLNQATEIYIKEGTSPYLAGKCVLGTAALDLYQATQNNAYLEFSLDILRRRKESLSADLFSQATCALLAQELYKVTNEEEHQEFKEEILAGLIENNFDYPGYGGYLTGEGCFYLKTDNIIKIIKENSLIVTALIGE